jgi:hypothetical protein
MMCPFHGVKDIIDLDNGNFSHYLLTETQKTITPLLDDAGDGMDIPRKTTPESKTGHCGNTLAGSCGVTGYAKQPPL